MREVVPIFGALLRYQGVTALGANTATLFTLLPLSKFRHMDKGAMRMPQSRISKYGRLVIDIIRRAFRHKKGLFSKSMVVSKAHWDGNVLLHDMIFE